MKIARCIGVVAKVVVVIGLIASADVMADEAKRFPRSHITAEQWQTYFDEVKAKPGAQDISRADRPDVIAIAVEKEHTIYYFTRPGPVHPAVVVARVIERDRKVVIDHEGYFAGSETAFARWFEGFRK